MDEVQHRLGRHGHLLGKVSARSSSSSKYSVTITIPMKGAHGVQAIQYRKGKKVSSSATKYFTVTP